MKPGIPPRVIEEKLVWSSRCREHFLPWQLVGSDAVRDAGIAEAGISDTHPGYELGRVKPRFHLLLYPTHGAGLYFSESTEGQVKAGECLVVPRDHAFGYRPSRRRWRFLWFHLEPSDRWAQLSRKGIQARRTTITEQLDRAMTGLLHESRKQSKMSQRAAALYSELLATYVEHDSRHSLKELVPDIEDQLAILWEIVSSDLQHPWTVDELARRLGVSRAHLHRLTLEHDGMSPMRMVTRLRMEKAQEMLILHDEPTRVIAEAIGYQDEFAFAVAFKRYSGSTPGKFRKRR